MLQEVARLASEMTGKVLMMGECNYTEMDGEGEDLEPSPCTGNMEG